MSGPTSPNSDSGSSSSRSDWFRQSVLFWSSQSERSIDRDSPNGNRYVPLEETDEETNNTPSEGSEEEFDQKPKKNIIDEFDPSDLLKQVEELERCFKKSRPESLIENEVHSTTSSGIGSPHLTLEFPTGSSIRENPLFKKDLVLRKKGYEKTSERKDGNVDHLEGTVISEKNHQIELELDLQETEMNRAVALAPVTEDKAIIESIQKVQNTLSEISREIERSSSSRLSEGTISDNDEMDRSENNTPRNDIESVLNDESVSDNRDPNDVMRDWLSNIKPPPPPSNICDSKEPVSDLKDSNLMEEKRKLEPSCLEVPRIPQILSPRRSSATPSHDELFQKIDELINFERPDSENTLCSHRSSSAKSSNRDRLDSGLQSVSSDSGSPYPSPNITRAPLRQPPKSQTIREVLHENRNDHVFQSDSDFSEWSPVSTLDSNRGGGSHVSMSHHPRSRSISYSPRNARQIHYSNSDGNVKNGDLETNGQEETVKKFLKLTKKYLDSDGVSGLSSTISLDDLAILPNLKETLEQQRRELEDQRKKQEEFLHQLGDLLLEVVTLKEQQSTVRSKQTKALNLLKKQLDAHKKANSQAHTDVINKVKTLDNKLNTSLSSADYQCQSQMSPISPGLGGKSFIYPTSGLNEFRHEESSHRGHIIWKVSDVMKKLTRIKTGSTEGTVVSPPFQTGEYGYRMNGWLYLNGRGKMTGQYLSLYVCVLVGEYDAILKWPIKPSYTLTVMDQNGDSHKRRDHVKVRRVLDIAGRGANVISQYDGIPRPSDCTKALIVGFDDFISHEKLLERKYLADDTLFIKIEATIT